MPNAARRTGYQGYLTLQIKTREINVIHKETSFHTLIVGDNEYYLYFFLKSSAAAFNSTAFFCIFLIALTASSTPFGPARKIFSSSHTASCSQARWASGRFIFSKSKYSGNAFGTANFDLCGWNNV